MKRLMMALAFAVCGMAFGEAEMEQSISYVQGWNLVYVKVAPNKSAEDLFKDWPVESVSLYDPAAFLDTKQYSAEDTTEGTTRNVMRIWRRGKPEVSGFTSVPADSILMFKASAAGSCTIVGTPCAPRVSWHQTASGAPRNYVGISTWGDVALADYFSGSGVLASDCAMVWGNSDIPQQAAIFSSQRLSDGTALAVNASRPGDWSGVLNVSPRNGIDFGTEGANAQLEIRNAGASARTVRVALTPGLVSAGVPTIPNEVLYVRDTSSAVTNGPWAAFSTETPIEAHLAAGETWRLRFALDRLHLSGSSGTVYGAILDIRDVDGGSKMRVTVPITATSDGGGASEFAWPKGLWLGVAELDKVSFFLTKEGDSTGASEATGMKTAGGKMKVRLPMYVDENGQMTLLQRFWYGRNTNGVLRAYSGAIKESDEPLYDVKRVSSAFLPTDQPEIALGEVNYDYYTVSVTNVVDRTNEVGVVVGQETNVVQEVRSRPVSANAFGDYALAEFTVGEDSNVNPMRHAPHPRHDGLTADYLRSTPSGDNLANYSGTLKPESFSITNRIEFVWDKTAASTWNPEETLSGSIKWAFDGIRHEGPIQAEGRFSMKRLSPVTMKTGNEK